MEMTLLPASKSGKTTELLIFFHGWGMDLDVLKHLDTGDLEVLLVYDYSKPLPKPDFGEMQKRYDKIYLAGWSLGIWMAAFALEEERIEFADSVAICGSMHPVSDEYGIPSEIFSATADNWLDSKVRDKFYFRTFGRDATRPSRAAADQRFELMALEVRITMLMQYRELPNPFCRAVIGEKDRIFVAANTKRDWQNLGIPVTMIATGHYPFGGLTCWDEILHL